MNVLIPAIRFGTRLTAPAASGQPAAAADSSSVGPNGVAGPSGAAGNALASAPATPLSAPTAPKALVPMLGHIDALEKSMVSFDVPAAKRKAAGIMAATMMASGVIGQVCKAFLPPEISLGLGAVLSLGVTCVGLAATSSTMRGLTDPSMLYGVGVMCFFTGFAEAASVTGNPLVIAACTAGASVALGALFASKMETRYNDVPRRIQHARQVAEKFATYQDQRAEVLKHVPQGGEP